MSTRTAFVIRRTISALVMIFLVLTLNFGLFRLLPGDASQSLGAMPHATKEVREQLVRDFGLDKSIPEQYVRYLQQFAQGNLGISYADRQPVAGRLAEALGNTIPLVLGAVILASVLALAFGTLAAYRQGTKVDTTVTGTALTLFSLPMQWVGLLLIMWFSSVFASGGMRDPFAINSGFWGATMGYLRHLTLPLITLTVALTGSFLLIVRSAVLETLGQDYVLTAKAKGLPTKTILRRYAVSNALLPIVTVFALALGYVAGGAVLVETVFSWPGIGRSVYESVGRRDYPMLQGAFLVLTVSVIFFTYLADLLYARLDPRVTS